MATQAAFWRRAPMAAAAPAVRTWTNELDAWRLRPLPCEDVYFYSKQIDNGRLVRQADPIAHRRAWKAGLKAALAAAALILFIMPKALSLVASHQVTELAQQHERLVRQKAALELEESQMLSPENLQVWAQELKLVNPDPNHIVFVSPKPEAALALNVGGTK